MPHFQCMVQLKSTQISLGTRSFDLFCFPVMIAPSQCQEDFQLIAVAKCFDIIFDVTLAECLHQLSSAL